MPYVFKDQRSGGRWAIAFKDANGRMRRERLDVSTRALARRVLASRLDDVERARLQGMDSIDALKPAPAPTLRAFAETFLKHVEVTRTTATHTMYAVTLGQVCGTLGCKTLTEVTTADIQAYADGRRRKGKAPATVQREWATISGLFALAVRQGVVQSNPCRGVTLARIESTVGRCLTEKEEASLLAHAPQEWREMLIVLLDTALRDAELRNLKWSDVDLEAGVITVRATKSHRDRVVPLTPRAAIVLDGIPKNTRDPYVFRSRATGHPFLGEKLSKRPEWIALKAKAGVECRVHDTRHTCLTRMVRGGAPLRAVQAFAGHASIAQTAHYSHVSGLEDLRAAVGVLAHKNGANATQNTTQGKKAAAAGA